MELEPIFISGIIFGFTYSVIFLFIRRSERFKLLEKGVDASYFLSPNKPQGFSALKVGLLFIGAALGLLLGGILNRMELLPENPAYFSMIFLFGGLALVIGHFLEKKEREKNSNFNG